MSRGLAPSLFTHTLPSSILLGMTRHPTVGSNRNLTLNVTFHFGGGLADITWKRTGALLRKLFQILMDAPEGLQAAVALAKVAEGVQSMRQEPTQRATAVCDRCVASPKTDEAPPINIAGLGFSVA